MENVNYDRIENLDQSSTNWKIKARVTRMWPSVTAESGSLKGFNLILLDDDNNHIHAFAYHNIWTALINATAIVEGNVYVIDQFSVKDAVGNLKPVQTKNCIGFSNSTIVTAAEDDGMIPKYKFEFLDLGDLFAEASKFQARETPEFAIDVIGVLEEYEPLRRIDTKFGERNIVKFRICDSSNNHKVSVWGELAVAVEEMHESQPAKKQIIVILTSTRVGTFMNSVQIGTLPSSKVYLNLDDESVTDMRMRLKQEDYESKAKRFLALPASELEATFFEKLSLKELNEKLTYDHLKKKIFCTVKILKVEEESSWWFFSCNKCKSEVESVDNKFKCSKCTRIIPVAPRRFRIVVLAEDSTFACSIVLMDRVARRILGTSAAKILDDLKKVPEEGVPKIIQSLVGKEVSVQIVLQKSNVTDDINIFNAEDLYDTAMPAPFSSSEVPHVSDASTINLSSDTFNGDDFLESPGSARSVTKKIKTEP